MKYNFDQVIDRRGTNCVKWDEEPPVSSHLAPRTSNLVSMWIADMDFAVCPAIIDALKKRLEHPVFGYTEVPQSYYDAVKEWNQRRHNWTVERQHIIYTSGVVPAISACIKAVTLPGDKVPDSVVHYGGKVYVLTNGSSFSAATLFPAVLVRNRRGVSVGRETGTGYHYMTALKFADIMLPNSLQTIRIPLVKLVFDETVCERLPEGRGLLPDYPVPLTYNEVMCGTDGETDVILDYALSLIAQGKYLSAENPFAAFDKEASQRNLNPIFLIGLLAISLLALAVALLARRKR